MEIVLAVIKYVLPLFIAMTAIVILVKNFLSNDQSKRRVELQLNNQKTITPIRLQAYERVILLLERISPENLTVRVSHPKMKVKDLHIRLLETIREEFDHNVSQQVYLTHETWELVKKARVQITQVVNKSLKGLNPEDNSIVLTRAILDNYMELDQSPIQEAIGKIKVEFQQMVL